MRQVVPPIFALAFTAGLVLALFVLDDATSPEIAPKAKRIPVPVAAPRQIPKKTQLDAPTLTTPRFAALQPSNLEPAALVPLSAPPAPLGTLDIGTLGLDGLLVDSAMAALTSALPTPVVVEQTPARAISRPPPTYPARAAAAGLEGEVVVRMRIDANGRVEDAVIVTATPPHVFDRAALKAARQYRFRPAREGDRTVASTLEQRIVFRAPKGAR